MNWEENFMKQHPGFPLDCPCGVSVDHRHPTGDLRVVDTSEVNTEPMTKDDAMREAADIVDLEERRRSGVCYHMEDGEESCYPGTLKDDITEALLTTDKRAYQRGREDGVREGVTTSTNNQQPLVITLETKEPYSCCVPRLNIHISCGHTDPCEPSLQPNKE